MNPVFFSLSSAESRARKPSEVIAGSMGVSRFDFEAEGNKNAPPR